MSARSTRRGAVRRSLALAAGALALSVCSLTARAHAQPEDVLEPAQAHAAEPAAGEEHHGIEHEFNWFYGLIGQSDDPEPSLLFRPKGMPAPFAATLFNAAILYWMLFRFGKKPIVELLKSRKARILRGMEEAAKMKREAEQRLAEYEAKLAKIDDEIERVREEMRRAGELEQRRILSDAREKRARMERDAHLLIEQELKAARESLARETVRHAVRSAERTLLQKLTEADQLRLAEGYLGALGASASSLRGRL